MTAESRALLSQLVEVTKHLEGMAGGLYAIAQSADPAGVSLAIDTHLTEAVSDLAHAVRDTEHTGVSLSEATIAISRGVYEGLTAVGASLENGLRDVASAIRETGGGE